jgi:hypothetical protein
MQTQIGMPFPAELTGAAGLCGIDGNQHSLSQRTSRSVQGIPADRMHHSREFMSEDQRSLHRGVPDATFAVRMEIAAAESDGPDVNLDDSWSGGWRRLDLINPHIPGTVDLCCFHVFLTLTRLSLSVVRV